MQSEQGGILFLNWKDVTHPSAGGAETLTDAIAEHIAQTHAVTYFTSAYPGCKKEETYHGYRIIRRGGVHTVMLHAWLYWHIVRPKQEIYRYIIDQPHGIPFFSIFYRKHPPVALMIMEIAGDLWKNILPSALVPAGKLAEKLWLTLYRARTIITISRSTKDDLIAHGISKRNIRLLPMFTTVPMPQSYSLGTQNPPTLLVLGRIAPVKQIEDAIDAYRIAKKSIPNLYLAIIGKSDRKYQAYKQGLASQIASDRNISLHENCTEEAKIQHIQKASLLLIPSKKEGYGLVILEAAAYGVPAIGYRVPGVQDAIEHSRTGILVPTKDIQALADAVCTILTQEQSYNQMRQQAFIHAKRHTREHTLFAFRNILFPKET